MHNFVVRKAPEKHTGNGRVLINYLRRDNARRFEVVHIVTPSGKQAFAAVIGHYDEPDMIKMDYDLRTTLGLKENEQTPLEITRCRLPGTIWWYLTVRDPLIRVPAILAAVSVILGVLSLALAFR
jgi:hypothetical protein